ncbi:SDR family NAD(P)-dependent oxidoreductase [Novosphingobium sp. JCM 18896]|uniref:SDR family NAD(P)-dependent oxidoreductase n=1 Tax=Novosphingobium sp. JCM 18896 TaxID=2989731 RepID=UPI002222BD44|nr:SDR family oxidoreductase [Novosphingobium sp. JCM 18896]MCW1431239.1 SDR family oxidoreductase [Novosphingobium sp. JCM 18896]
MTQTSKGIALVTGASSGIGAIYADRLARRGYDLILVARDKVRLEALAAKLHGETGRTVEVLAADLVDPVAVDALADRITREPRLTLLVNNAGMALHGTLLSAAPEELTRMIALNITAPTLLTRAAIHAFGEHGGGSVVNISSILAVAPEILDSAYAATKSYLLSLGQGLLKDAAERGVHIQSVLPGPTHTEFWERSGNDVTMLPPEWVMDAEDLVDAALVGLDRKEAVTIPPLHDTADWDAMQTKRLELHAQLARRQVAPRYREAIDA